MHLITSPFTSLSTNFPTILPKPFHHYHTIIYLTTFFFLPKKSYSLLVTYCFNMLLNLRSFYSIVLLGIFLLVVVGQTQGMPTRKLQQETAPGGEKCTPCNPSPPPPPPLCPPPPPPVLPPPPPVLPPPSPKKPPSGYCPPPPPPPSFIYITGPPGSLYPIDNDFGGSSRSSSGLPVLFLSGLLVLLVRFGF